VDKGSKRQRTWHDSGHASLCVLGSYLRLIGFFRPLEAGITLKQKVRKYTSVQKLEMLFVSLVAGAKAVSQTSTTLKVDRALQVAFGRPGCAEQSVIADTLDAATEQAVAERRQVVEATFVQHSQARQHGCAGEVLVLDLDLSPLPASKRSEGAERCSMGRCRSKTGRKLVRVRAAQYQETVWEAVWPGRTVETLAVVQAAVAAAERLLDLVGDHAEARARRARVEWRLDSGWGSDESLTWLLARGYQVTGKFTSNSRVRKLVQGIPAWEPTSSPGRDVAAVPTPVELCRPTRQYAVRTPSAKQPDGYQYAVVLSSRLELDMLGVIDHYDGRAGMEAELKGDKRGLGLGTLRKGRLPAQQMVVLLMTLAHNVLVWSRRWLARGAPRLASFGIVRLIQEVWAVPGRVKLADSKIRRVRLRPEHPRARDVYRGLAAFCQAPQTLGFLG
jgi:hypothetical protein